MKEYPEVDNGIARIKLVYEWATGYCISFIIADDKEVQEYIKASILSIDTEKIPDERIINYNFCENLKNARENIKKFQKGYKVNPNLTDI